MLTLHQATTLTKNFLKWGLLTITLLVIIILLFKGGQIIKEIIKPTPPPPPTVTFGKLPAIEFPISILLIREFTYSLDTVTGKLPSFPDRAKVYKINYPASNLLALKKAQSTVSRIGFPLQPVFVSENLYQWSHLNNLFKKLTLDILSYNFTLSSNFINNEEIVKATYLPNEDQAIKLAQNFLTEIGALPSDLDETKTKTTLFSIKNSQVIPTTSLSSAQLIQVNFFQKNVDDLPIFYSNPLLSTMTFLIAGGKYQGQVVRADFYHQSADVSEVATYPLKSTEEAFSELKEGKAFFASYQGQDKNVSLKNIFLAYYLGEEKQAYLMPMIVFEGNYGFYAYLSAIKEEWLKK